MKGCKILFTQLTPTISHDYKWKDGFHFHISQVAYHDINFLFSC